LTFRFLNGVTVFHIVNFQLPVPFHSRLSIKHGTETERQTDRQTDGQTDNGHQCIMLHPMDMGIITGKMSHFRRRALDYQLYFLAQLAIVQSVQTECAVPSLTFLCYVM